MLPLNIKNERITVMGTPTTIPARNPPIRTYPEAIKQESIIISQLGTLSYRLVYFSSILFSFTQFFLYNSRALCISYTVPCSPITSYQILDSTAALSIGSPLRYLSINSLNPLTPSGSGSRVLPSFPANTRLSRNSSRVSPSFLSTR